MVGKAVIRQAFIRQMPPSVRAHLATQPDSASLENLPMLADPAVAAENTAIATQKKTYGQKTENRCEHRS